MSWTALNFFFYMMTNWFIQLKEERMHILFVITTTDSEDPA